MTPEIAQALVRVLFPGDFRVLANQAWQRDQAVRARLIAANLLEPTRSFSRSGVQRFRRTKLGMNVGRWNGGKFEYHPEIVTAAQEINLPL